MQLYPKPGGGVYNGPVSLLLHREALRDSFQDLKNKVCG